MRKSFIIRHKERNNSYMLKCFTGPCAYLTESLTAREGKMKRKQQHFNFTSEIRNNVTTDMQNG